MANRGFTPSPPVDFVVYGLSSSWGGSRWVESFDCRIGDPVQGLRLAHRAADGSAEVLVNTYPRELPSRVRLSWWPDVEAVAWGAAHQLVNMTLPEPSLPRPPGFLPGLVARAENAAAEISDWATIEWWVDGASVTARVWWFADGWAGVLDVLPDVYVTAVGVGSPPEGLALTAVRDTESYGFDLTQPLSPDVIYRSAARPEGPVAMTPIREQWHPDQLALM